jgi:hypothetical protein
MESSNASAFNLIRLIKSSIKAFDAKAPRCALAAVQTPKRCNVPGNHILLKSS